MENFKKNYLKLIMCFLILLFFQKESKAQHFAKSSALEANFGMSNFSNSISGSYIYFLSGRFDTRVFGLYEWGGRENFPYHAIGSGILFDLTLIRLSKIFFLTGGLGAIISHEKLGVTDAFLNYGGLAKIETELYLNKLLAFTISANQTILLKRELGDTRFNISAGFRFIL